MPREIDGSGPSRRVWLGASPAPSFSRLRITHAELEQILQEYLTSRDPGLRDRLVVGHEGLVRYVIGRFKPMGSIAYEDLMQVGQIGLIAAIERFDPAAGVPFVTFAVPTIVGTLKHYLRDHAWTIKAPRRVRELGLAIRRYRAELERKLGRSPTPSELAEAAGVSEEAIFLAMDVDQCFAVQSLDAVNNDSDAPQSHAERALGVPDPELSRTEARQALSQAIASLEERLQLIIQLRFFANATQTEVAERLGISQMHVSRLERKALRLLREALY